MQNVHIDSTPIPGLIVIRLNVKHNDDGWFKENWHRAKHTALGLPDFDPVQHNVTHVVNRGITRGFTAEPWDRLVSVTSGRAMGAWVDLREGETFGRTFHVDLDRSTSVFVPRGVANAHQVLEDGTTFNYLLEHHWTPEARGRSSFVDLFDPALAIPWPIGRSQAIVAHRDTLHPPLSGAKPIAPRRSLIVGTETPLGRMLASEVPGATGVKTERLALEAEPIDLSAFDTLINASGSASAGTPRQFEPVEGWSEAAARSTRLADIARRHRLRYVHISADCVFERPAPEHDESQLLDLTHPHGQALAAGEVIAASVPRHLIIRTGWVVGRDEGFVQDMAVRARRGETAAVVAHQFGRLTYADQLAAGITHLLNVGAESGIYNLTGDGRVASWADIARRIYQIAGADPGRVLEEAAREPRPDAVLNLSKIKATGFRPQNSWLDLVDKIPGHEGSIPRPAAPAAPEQEPRHAGAYKVMFVCTANICRSAYADVAARAAGLSGVEFMSAGTQALVGREIDPPMAARLESPSAADAHRAQQLTRNLLEDADLVLAMASDHRRYILDTWPMLGRKVFVIGHVARELARVPEGLTLDGLTDHLWRNRTSSPADDVADPYARGEAAAQLAADTIDAHLATILRVLAELPRRA